MCVLDPVSHDHTLISLRAMELLDRVKGDIHSLALVGALLGLLFDGCTVRFALSGIGESDVLITSE